ncbi:hypothetical protein ES319_A11G262400v1 [Gossypium barbadense]|uniref:3'-5' exonuclease domain-containing protein n=1 Tax=Gossypium barbadense TaxID=3634 RepID=A0A5J5TY12_GOSBA|nr:hypothetical protein ES319_A11G262400v1 [Gossypium barbadense]
MPDGTVLVSEEILDTTRLAPCLDLVWEDMIEHEDMVAGLDVTWYQYYSSDYILLLVICTRIGCVLIRFGGFIFGHLPQSLQRFLNNKNISFVGVHIKEDVNRSIRNNLPLEIRNAVDVGELAADVLHQPHFRGLGLGRLATVVLEFPLRSRSSRMAQFYYTGFPWLEMNEIESLTTDAYAAYKLGKKLLGF